MNLLDTGRLPLDRSARGSIVDPDGDSLAAGLRSRQSWPAEADRHRSSWRGKSDQRASWFYFNDDIDRSADKLIDGTELNVSNGPILQLLWLVFIVTIC